MGVAVLERSWTPRRAVRGLPDPLLDHRAVWLGLFGATPVASVAAAMALSPIWSWDAPLAVALNVLFAGLFAMGVALLGEPGQRAPGYALIGSGMLLLVAWSEEWGGGPWPVLSKAVGNEWLLLGAWALYRYPDPRLSRPDRWFFALFGLWLSVPALAIVATSRPQWHDYSADAWWPTIHPDAALSGRIEDVSSAGLLVIAATYLSRWVVRLRTAHPADRRRRTPPAAAAIVATLVAGLVPLAGMLGASDAAVNTVYLVEAAAIVAVPLAFLVAILRRQLARTRVTHLVHAITGPPSAESVRAALRTALEDQDLDLAFWDDDRAGYVCVETGRALRDGGTTPLDGAERAAAYVATSDGAPLAVVLADPAVVRDPELLSAAVAVAGFSLEIARLLDTVRRQLDDLRAASTRAVRAADAERRRLEQDLHDGAQQHFLALGPLIGAAEASTRDERTARQLADVRAVLLHALRELREFARGVHPTALSAGLTAAVEQVAATLPVPVRIDLPAEWLPQATAHAAYLVVNEALANVRRHADATSVDVSGRVADGVLTLVVEDDGVGGAVAGPGSGIMNMQDRAAALGGTLDLHSPPGGGTRLTVGLPCA